MPNRDPVSSRDEGDIVKLSFAGSTFEIPEHCLVRPFDIEGRTPSGTPMVGAILFRFVGPGLRCMRSAPPRGANDKSWQEQIFVLVYEADAKHSSLTQLNGAKRRELTALGYTRLSETKSADVTILTLRSNGPMRRVETRKLTPIGNSALQVCHSGQGMHSFCEVYRALPKMFVKTRIPEELLQKSRQLEASVIGKIVSLRVEQ